MSERIGASARAPAWDLPPWPIVCRALALILLTALLVARPLIPGEDAAMLIPLSDTSGPWLVMLGLVALVLWAVGSAGEGRRWSFGWVEAALGVLAAMQFLSAAVAASYRHPAWLVAWEWAALVAVVALVRQCRADRRLILAVMLATGTATATYALYQSWVELPDLLAQLQKQKVEIDRTADAASADRLREDLLDRVKNGHVFATFGHPNSFAGYLLLLLPLAVGAALKSSEARWPIAGIAALMALALWLTHSRGGLLAAALVGLLVLLWWQRSVIARRWPWAVVGAVVLVGVSVVAWRYREALPMSGKNPEAVRVRLDYWTATWAMICDHPWLGVGPGNFVRHYPAYMPLVPQAHELIRDPHQFALEVWASAGVVAVAALMVALGVFGGQCLSPLAAWRGVSEDSAKPQAEDSAKPRAAESSPALFLVGGALGLTLALLFSVDFDPMRLGILVLIWFASFGLFLRFLPPGGWVVGASLAGVLGLMLNLLVSGGIGSPAVAQPLWAVVGLALAYLPVAERPAGSLMRWLPAALAVSVAGTYLVTVFVPLTTSHSHLGHAAYLQTRPFSAARDRAITQQLQAAHAAALGDVRPLIELANWQWTSDRDRPWRDRAAVVLPLIDEARRLDPRSHQLGIYRFQADLQLAQLVESDRQNLLAGKERSLDDAGRKRAAAELETERETYLTQAEEKLAEVLRLHPSIEARLRLDLAAALGAMKDPRARVQAEKAHTAHEAATSAVGRLSALQLEQLNRHRGP